MSRPPKRRNGLSESLANLIVFLASAGALAIWRTPAELLLGIAGVSVSASGQMRDDPDERGRAMTLLGALGSILFFGLVVRSFTLSIGR